MIKFVFCFFLQNWYSHQFVCLQVLDFLKSKSNFADLMLKHMDTSAIMDLLIILLSKIDDDDLRINILNVSFQMGKNN